MGGAFFHACDFRVMNHWRALWLGCAFCRSRLGGFRCNALHARLLLAGPGVPVNARPLHFSLRLNNNLGFRFSRVCIPCPEVFCRIQAREMRQHRHCHCCECKRKRALHGFHRFSCALNHAVFHRSRPCARQFYHGALLFGALPFLLFHAHAKIGKDVKKQPFRPPYALLVVDASIK